MRVTVAQRKAVGEVLRRLMEGGYLELDDAVDDLIEAAHASDTSRYAVVTRDPHGHLMVHGPYASHGSAGKAIASGRLANVPDTKGGVFPLVPPISLSRKGAGSTREARSN